MKNAKLRLCCGIGKNVGRIRVRNPIFVDMPSTRQHFFQSAVTKLFVPGLWLTEIHTCLHLARFGKKSRLGVRSTSQIGNSPDVDLLSLFFQCSTKHQSFQAVVNSRVICSSPSSLRAAQICGRRVFGSFFLALFGEKSRLDFRITSILGNIFGGCQLVCCVHCHALLSGYNNLSNARRTQ